MTKKKRKKKKPKGTDQYDTATFENPNRFVEKRNLQPHPLIKISCNADNVTRARAEVRKNDTASNCL